MEDRQQWLSIAAVVLVIGGLGFFLYKRSRQATNEPTAMGEGVQIEDRANQLLDQMNVKIPENADKIGLKDVSGGDATGIATKSFNNNVFSGSIIAALPELGSGEFYEGWLVREDPFDLVGVGKLRQAKGGWMVDFTSNTDLSDHKQVVVTQEMVDDQKPEKHILEGQFN